MRRRFLLIVIIFVIFGPGYARGQDSPMVGKTVYLLYACDFRTRPMWQGYSMGTEAAGRSFTVLSVEEEGNWYKVKSINSQIGYLAVTWVTTDRTSIDGGASTADQEQFADETGLNKSNEEAARNERIARDGALVGLKVYLLDSYPLTAWPKWEGELIMQGTRGMEFTVTSVEDCDFWYKVRAANGREGYLANSWVTADVGIIEKMRAEEIAEKEEEAAAAKERQKQEVRALKARLNNMKKKHSSWSTKDCETIVAGKVRLGMNTEQCKEAWGNPAQVSNTITVFGTHSQWCYGEYCSSALYFKNGILTTIQN